MGLWALSRTVEDLRSGQSGTVSGTLDIAPAGSRLAWVERGRLTWGARTVDVTRTSYLLDLAGAPWMTFADGRPFHPWRPGEEVEHPCGDDLYRGRIDLAAGRMTTTWRVTGPAKAQLLRTELVRR